MADYSTGGILPFPQAECDKLLSLGDGGAALLYLFVLRHSRMPRPDEALTLGLTTQTVKDLTAKLETAKLLTKPSKPMLDETTPTYDAKDIADGVKRDPAFAYVLNETQRMLGIIFSSSDLQIFYKIYDWRGLPPDVLLMLVTYCVEDYKHRFGQDSNPPKLSQIDKEAAYWQAHGIQTVEAAERHLKWLENRRTRSAQFLRVLGMSGRAISTTEQKYLGEWADMGFTPEVFAVAYDKTCIGTGSGFAWRYCAKILSRWHESGWHTLKELPENERTVGPFADSSARSTPTAIQSSTQSGAQSGTKSSTQPSYPASKTPMAKSNRPLSEPGDAERKAIEKMKDYLNSRKP